MNKSRSAPLVPCFIIFLMSSLTACKGPENNIAYGTLERETITLLATRSEMISAIEAMEGSNVTPGQLLVQLDDSEQRLILAQEQAELSRLKALLLELENGHRKEQIAAATATHMQFKTENDLAKQQLARQKRLFAEGLSQQEELDLAQANYDVSSSVLRVAEAQLTELENGQRSEVLIQAHANVERQKYRVAQQQKLLEDLRIVATREGLLEDLPYQLGERIPAGGIAAIISAQDSTFARIYLPQKHLANTAVGRSVEVLVDGKTRPLQGTVRQIARESSFTPYFALQQEDRTRLVYLIEVTVFGADDLPTGIPVQLALPLTNLREH